MEHVARPSSGSIRQGLPPLYEELRYFADSINVVMLPKERKYFFELEPLHKSPSWNPFKGNGGNGRHRKVSVICPKCKTKAELVLDPSIFNEDLSTVSIPRRMVCEHEFQAFIDANGAVRGYQAVDYIIQPNDCTSCVVPSMHRRLSDINVSLQRLQDLM